MDTIRELIIQAIIDRLAAIVTTGSPVLYNYDLGEHVYRATKRIPPDLAAYVAVWPGVETAKRQPYGMIERTMPVEIEGAVLFGDTDPSVAGERILGDLERCLTGTDWSRSPDYIRSIAYIGGGIEEYPDANHVRVGATAYFQIVYETAIGNPYSSGA